MESSYAKRVDCARPRWVLPSTDYTGSPIGISSRVISLSEPIEADIGVVAVAVEDCVQATFIRVIEMNAVANLSEVRDSADAERGGFVKRFLCAPPKAIVCVAR